MTKSLNFELEVYPISLWKFSDFRIEKVKKKIIQAGLRLSAESFGSVDHPGNYGIYEQETRELNFQQLTGKFSSLN